MESQLAGKVVVVTGASGGIGQSVVRRFVTEGAKVAIHFHRGRTHAENLAKEFDPAMTCVVGADLREESQVQQMFQSIEQSLGPTQILVANAGFWPPEDKSLLEMGLDRWLATMQVDLTSVFLSVREFLKQAVAHKIEDPATVLIGSTAGLVGEAGHADYATAKGGIMSGLLNSLKNEIPKFASRGRVNCVCPGWTLTPMADKLTGNEHAMKRALQTIPLRKFGKPDDVASAVLFFASNYLAGHVTGESLFVSGGMEGRVLNELDSIDLATAL